MKAVPRLVQHIRDEMGKVVVGQNEIRDQCVIALLCRGHVLLEGVPGIAKTLIVKTLSRLMRLSFQRVQCTSDLMPADIVGTNVLNMATGAFQLHQGPVFTDLLLVDEVNRMPPRTQAALLECMEEHQVTIDGVGNHLSQFFTVFATQNPVEFEGTYPLPEAQLDRFLLKLQVPYPGLQDEVRLLANVQNGFESRELDKDYWSRRSRNSSPSRWRRRCSVTSYRLPGALASGHLYHLVPVLAPRSVSWRCRRRWLHSTGAIT